MRKEILKSPTCVCLMRTWCLLHVFLLLLSFLVWHILLYLECLHCLHVYLKYSTTSIYIALVTTHLFSLQVKAGAAGIFLMPRSTCEKQRTSLPLTHLIASITLQSVVNTAINILCQLFQNTLCLAGCSDNHEMLFKKPNSCFMFFSFTFRAYD